MSCKATGHYLHNIHEKQQVALIGIFTYNMLDHCNLITFPILGKLQHATPLLSK